MIPPTICGVNQTTVDVPVFNTTDTAKTFRLIVAATKEEAEWVTELREDDTYGQILDALERGGDLTEEEHEDKELAHPDLFRTSFGYDIELYYRMAMARRTQITSQFPDDMPGNQTLIALPKYFGKVLIDVIEPATVKFLVYSHFSDLADQLQKQCISSASTPRSTPRPPS
ncbi:unnamed protein product [Heligmosomoides polygyrus]|uniref:PH domain-containing protein n=1 Tax=Heligmosomoides polygyrus TaxID=6339 RepID=A0A183GFW6_HELPZ|nr:unnamed protein product [Heligmosomoides polygyrus]